MKKSLFILIALATRSVSAQQFGVTAGYLNGFAKLESPLVDATGNNNSFFVGFLAEFSVSEKFNIQPELQYTNINSSGSLLLPVLAKYYVAEKFNLQAGPQLVIGLGEVPTDYSSVDVGLAFGVGYDIDEHFSLLTRYAFQLNNSYKGNDDITARVNFLNIGIAYKF